MSVATPKIQTKEPIDLDMLVVCRKRESDHRPRRPDGTALGRATASTTEAVNRFNGVGRRLSRNDVRVVLLSQILVELSAGRTPQEIVRSLGSLLPQTRRAIDEIWEGQDSQDAGVVRSSREALPQALFLWSTDPGHGYT